MTQVTPPGYHTECQREIKRLTDRLAEAEKKLTGRLKNKDGEYDPILVPLSYLKTLEQDLKIQTDLSLEYEKMVQGLQAEVQRLKAYEKIIDEVLKMAFDHHQSAKTYLEGYAPKQIFNFLSRKKEELRIDKPLTPPKEG